MQSKYQTFDDELIEDGWYVAQYKTEREVVFVYKGKLYTGPWINDDGDLILKEDTSKKHHDFKPIDKRSNP